MATSFTYATLKATLQNWNEDHGTTFASDVDTIIKLAEDKVLKDLNLAVFDAISSLSGASAISTATPSKPSGTILTRTLSITVSSETVFLIRRSKSYIQSYWPNAATTGVPKYYADDYTESAWLIAPTPGTSYNGSAMIMKRPESLVASSPSWLSQHVGDLLMKACMVESGIYSVADERMALLNADYERALGKARIDLRSLIRTDYSPLGAQPVPQGERT